MSQLKTQFNRLFYTWNLQPLMDSLYQNCISAPLSRSSLRCLLFTNKEQKLIIHIVSSDIIRQHGQYIMLLVDHFSNLAQALLTNSEKAIALMKTLISLTRPIRHPGPITISTDNATCFHSLKRNADEELLTFRYHFKQRTNSTRTIQQSSTKLVKSWKLSSASFILKAAKSQTQI